MSRAAARAGDALAKIVPEVERTSALVQEIVAASVRQEGSTAAASRAVQELSRVVGQNASAAEEMAATAEELAAQAAALRASVASFVLDDRPGVREIVERSRSLAPRVAAGEGG